jgi:hypothetical protein
MSEDNRPEPPMTASPVEMVSAFLDFHRATLLWKIDGLSEDDLRRPMVPSGVCLLGIVKHSAYVERWWFQAVFAGEDLPFPWTDQDRDADWRIEPADTPEAIVALYRRETERSREILRQAQHAGGGWDDRAKRPGFDHTLGWILTHMVEEVARHNGHADILREQIDGQTGE